MNSKPLLFLHVPKTGGTTINFILSEIYKFKFLWLRNDIIQQQSNFIQPLDIYHKIPSDKKMDFKAISGHQILPLCDLLPNIYSRLLLVRNPINQIPSLYAHHLRHKSGNPSNKEVRSHSNLFEFVQSDSDFYPNPQCRNLFFYCPEIFEDAKEVKRRIESLVWNKIDLCGTTEKFEDFLSLLSENLKWRKFSYTVMNRAIKKKGDLPFDLNYLIERNELDFFLYEQVLKKSLDLQKTTKLNSNFRTGKSLSIQNKIINKIQQHRIISMTDLELKKEVRFKHSFLKALKKRS